MTPKDPNALRHHFERLRASKAGLETATEDAGLDERIRTVDVSDTSEEERERAVSAAHKMARHEPLDAVEAEAFEAIVLPAERPVVDVVGDSYGEVPAPFTYYAQPETRGVLERHIPAVGRIGVPALPALPYGGTGFVVGPDLLMTNRHVAVLFARGLGREGVEFQPGQSANVDFKQELGGSEPTPIEIREVLMIHPFWDMALLRVEGLQTDSLTLLSVDPGDLAGRDVAVLGYPAFDPRNDAQLQNRIFRRAFNVKRLQPGRVQGRGEILSFGKRVRALTHDSSTLGGNSGSAVIDVESGQCVALHFAGRYLEANFAVPAFEMARDRRVVDAGVRFSEVPTPGATEWENWWNQADPPRRERTARRASRGSAVRIESDDASRRLLTPTQSGDGRPGTADGSVALEIPLHIRVWLGDAPPLAPPTRGTPRLTAGASVEAMVEPIHEEDFANRTGYDPLFLGTPVPLPLVEKLDITSKLDDGEHVIPYEHFSLVMNRERRLAIFAASNIDGSPAAREPEPGNYTRRGLSGLGENDREKWFPDPRIPALHQLSDKFFNKDRTAFDKGHIVRRDAVTWGDSRAEVQRANGDTYHITNCSPQVKGFNRSGLDGVWGELENLVLDQAEENADRYTVLAGPVLDPDDPLFEGRSDEGRVEVQIPRAYWKVVVARGAAGLEAYAFLLEQNLDLVDFTELARGAGVESFFADQAEWSQEMISIADLEEELRLVRFPDALHQADQFDSGAGEAVRAAAGIARHRR